MKILYYAVFEYAPDGINIRVPDFPCCLTCAWSDEEAIKMAKDALSLTVHNMLPEQLPLPTPKEKIKINKNEKLVLISISLEIRNGLLFSAGVDEF